MGFRKAAYPRHRPRNDEDTGSVSCAQDSAPERLSASLWRLWRTCGAFETLETVRAAPSSACVDRWHWEISKLV